MNSRLVEFRPPRIAQLLILGAVLLHWATPFDLPLYANRALGLLVGAGGFAIMMWAWWLFRKSATAICPTDTPSVLVSSGIFRITRNPMYLGMFGILIGIAVFVGGLFFYVAAIVYFTVMNVVFCPYEENKLSACFGDAYGSYSARVGRWI